MKYLLVLLIMLSAVCFADYKTVFSEGCKEYDHKQYDKAIAKFNELLYDGVESGELYYNLGNAYYKNGDIVNSLVSYERAAKLIGNDDDLQANLSIARQKVIDKIETKPVLPVFEYLSNLRKGYNIYTIKTAILISLLTTVVLAVLLFFFHGLPVRITLYTLTAASGLYLIAMSVFAYNIVREQQLNFGIIASDKISVLASPDDNLNNTELFSLHKGAKVQIHRKSDKWLEISVGKDKKGWVPGNELIQI